MVGYSHTPTIVSCPPAYIHKPQAMYNADHNSHSNIVTYSLWGLHTLPHQSVKLHYTVTFHMLHCGVTFHET